MAFINPVDRRYNSRWTVYVWPTRLPPFLPLLLVILCLAQLISLLRELTKACFLPATHTGTSCCLLFGLCKHIFNLIRRMSLYTTFIRNLKTVALPVAVQANCSGGTISKDTRCYLCVNFCLANLYARNVQLNNLLTIDFYHNLRGHKDMHLGCLASLLKPEKEKLLGPP